MAYPNCYQPISIPIPCYQPIPIPIPCYQPVPAPIPQPAPCDQAVPVTTPCKQTEPVAAPCNQAQPVAAPCNQTQPQYREIARQDVICTPDGPIEIFRRDMCGNTVTLPKEKARQLLDKYTMQQVPKLRSRSRPCYRSRSRGDPGLYRDHILVKGDSIDSYQCGRKYVNYRNPFDWYNTCRFDLIDDIEEVLEEEPYSQYDEMYSNRSYCPSRSHSRRSHSRSKSRARSTEMSRKDYEDEEEEDVVYIIKKKNPSQNSVSDSYIVEEVDEQKTEESYNFSSGERRSSSYKSPSSLDGDGSSFRSDKNVTPLSQTDSLYSYEPVKVNPNETKDYQYKTKGQRVDEILNDLARERTRKHTNPESVELLEKFHSYLNLNK